MIVKTDIFMKNPSMIASDMYNEYGFVNIETGKYYLIKESGVLIYDEIDGRRTIEELVEFFVKSYQVEYAKCLADIIEFVTDIAEKNIIIKANDESIG